MPFESKTSAILVALVLVAAPSLSNRSDAQQAPAQAPSTEDVVFVGAGDIAVCGSSVDSCVGNRRTISMKIAIITAKTIQPKR